MFMSDKNKFIIMPPKYNIRDHTHIFQDHVRVGLPWENVFDWMRPGGRFYVFFRNVLMMRYIFS